MPGRRGASVRECAADVRSGPDPVLRRRGVGPPRPQPRRPCRPLPSMSTAAPPARGRGFSTPAWSDRQLPDGEQQRPHRPACEDGRGQEPSDGEQLGGQGRVLLLCQAGPSLLAAGNTGQPCVCRDGGARPSRSSSGKESALRARDGTSCPVTLAAQDAFLCRLGGLPSVGRTRTGGSGVGVVDLSMMAAVRSARR